MSNPNREYIVPRLTTVDDVNQELITREIRRHCMGCPKCQTDYDCRAYDILKALEKRIIENPEQETPEAIAQCKNMSNPNREVKHLKRKVLERRFGRLVRTANLSWKRKGTTVTPEVDHAKKLLVAFGRSIRGKEEEFQTLAEGLAKQSNIHV